MKIIILILASVLLMPLAAAQSAETSDSMRRNQAQSAVLQEYTEISQAEAQRIMREEENYLIVDVRRQDEYDQGHIPGAICIPNETIGAEPIQQLPDMDQMLLVYCRSGRRSKEAARKLAAIGYTEVLEFGGIMTWTGEIEK